MANASKTIDYSMKSLKAKRFLLLGACSLIAGAAIAAPWSGSGTYTVGSAPGSDYASLSAFNTAMTGFAHGSGLINAAAVSTAVTGVNTKFLSEVGIGDTLYSGALAPVTVASIESDTSLTLTTGFSAVRTSAGIMIKKAAAPAAVSGNVTVEINSNITEPNNIPVLVNMGANILTIKPAASTSPVINFTRADDNSGFSGHLLFGVGVGSSDQLIASGVDNWVIDGSNNGTSSRDMTILSATNFAFDTTIFVGGDSDNWTIKNTNLINASTNTGGSVSPLNIRTRVVGTAISGFAAAGTYIPNGYTIQNNNISVNAATQGTGIITDVSGTLATGDFSQRPFTIADNTIEARLRGINLSGGSIGDIVRNKISAAGSYGFDNYGILLNNGRSPAAGTANYSNNQITVNAPAHATVGSQGGQGVALTSAGTGLTVVYNVDNNVINLTHLNAPAATTALSEVRGIRGSSFVTYNFRHNTIRITDAANVTGQNGAEMHAIGTPGAGNYAATITNNILTVDEQGVPSIRRTGAPTTPANLVINNNVLDSPVVARDNATDLNLAGWQALGYDANSNTNDVIAAGINTVDLHWGTDPGATWTVANPILTTDVDIETRNVSTPYRGADEFLANGVPTDIVSSTFTGTGLTVAENASTNTIVGTLTAVDPNPYDLGTMVLTDDAGGRFAILRVGTADRLVVANQSLVNFENAFIHNVTAQFTDRAGATYSEVFAITVTDANDAPTDIALSNATTDNTAGPTTVGTLSTTDADLPAQTFTYTLVAGAGSTNNALFTIVGSDLQTVGAMNAGTYSVRVRSTDSGTPAAFFEEAFTITVADITVPTSAASATDTSQVGPNISVDYTSSDSNSAVTNVALWVKTPGAGSFANSGVSSAAASGTFSYTGATDGVYEFYTIATDGVNTESAPVSADVAIAFNDVANSELTLTATTGNDTLVFPMTASRNITIALTGATANGTLSVDREAPRGTVPTGLFYPDRLVDERMDITGTGLGTFTSTITWAVDPANIGTELQSLGINTAYRAVSGALAETLTASETGGVITISGVTGFSSWYAGNSTAVPVTLSGFAIE